MGNWALLSLLTITWLLWAFGAVLANHIAKREGRAKPDSGVSVTPILPFFPLVFFGFAKLADHFAPPWGTWLIGGLHALLAGVFIVVVVLQSLRPASRAP